MTILGIKHHPSLWKVQSDCPGISIDSNLYANPPLITKSIPDITEPVVERDVKSFFQVF